jgi:predicted amino acid dehydrogenase
MAPPVTTENTMFAAIRAALWRALCHLADWRGHWRHLTGRPAIDVAIITNVRDESERRLFWGAWRPRCGHASGARIYLNGVAGRVRGLDVTAEELMTKEGRQRGRALFLDAVRWSYARGARVVLLAASTKRLFGRDGAALKEAFPDVLFTIGDNGTALLLCQDVQRALDNAGIGRGGRVLVIGPYGILGTEVTCYLQAQGYRVAGFGATRALLAEFGRRFPGIALYRDVHNVGEVDAVVACTHSADAKLDVQAISKLRRTGRKLLVVDVAEPANLDAATYADCRRVVVRQDAGNASSPMLHYVLGTLSSGMLKLAHRTVFGCFAEALTLHHAIYREQQYQRLNQDWFNVNSVNMAALGQAFQSVGVSVAAPHCFGRAVTGFDLQLAGDTRIASEHYKPRQPAGSVA